MATLELVRIEEFIYSNRDFPRHSPEDRIAITKARKKVTQHITDMKENI